MNRASAHFAPRRPLRSAALATAIIAGLAAAIGPAIAIGMPLTGPVTQLHAQRQTAAEILDSVRRSTGYDALTARDRDIVMKGQATIASVDSQGTFMFSPSGEVLWEVVGRLSTTIGFDGKTAWERNENGIARTLALDDRETRLTGMDFLTGRWLAKDTALDFTVAPESPDGSIILEFKRGDSSTHGTIEIDDATRLPRKVVIEGGTSPETIQLSDFTEFEGARVFGRFSQQQGDNPPATFTVKEVADAPTFIRNPYEPVLSLPDNFRFDPAASPRIEVRTAPTRHHLIKALINGQDVGYFIFDSGAGTEVISTKVAEQLKLESFGKVPVRGVGATIDAGFYQPESLVVGPMTIDKPILVGLDLSFLDQFMGVPVAGIIGYGVLGRCAAVIDADGGWIELHDTAKYSLPAGEWTPVALYGRHPAVKGAIEGHEGFLRLDTGAANTTITVHAPTVSEFRMLEDRNVTDAMMGGVGGMIKAKSGVLKSVTLGGRTFENVTATFALPGDSAMNDRGTLANVGGQLLKPFVLVFDYPHERMAFIPRDEADQPAAIDADTATSDQ
ncbi:MAG: hypothetical protein AMXMBFR58_05980 [Phycisphaerae bacterium]